MTSIGTIMAIAFATLLLLGWALLIVAPLVLAVTMGVELERDIEEVTPEGRKHILLKNVSNVDFTHLEKEPETAPKTRLEERPQAHA